MSTILEMLRATVTVGLLLALGMYVVGILDVFLSSVAAGRRAAVGDVLLAPVRRTALLLVSSSGRIQRSDVRAWAVAPALLAGIAAVAIATIPLSPTLSIADTSAGFVIYSAAIMFVMIAVFLHGWSPNSPFAMHGAYRYGAQSLSLQVPFLLAVLATTLPAESLSIGAIVEAQASLWNVVRQPLGLPLYLLAGLGVPSWGPLNLPDAEDLAGGTMSEVGGVAALSWRLAEAAMLVAVAVMGAAAFLGGWWGPWGPGLGWMLAKTLLLLALLVATRQVVARLRLERLVLLCWTVLLPIGLVNLAVAGAWLL